MVVPPSSFSLFSVGSIVACHTHSLATALCILWVVKVQDKFDERDMDKIFTLSKVDCSSVTKGDSPERADMA